MWMESEIGFVLCTNERAELRDSLTINHVSGETKPISYKVKTNILIYILFIVFNLLHIVENSKKEYGLLYN